MLNCMTCVKNYTNWGPELVIMTSVPSDTDATIAVYEGSTDTVITYSVPLIPVKATGTGDIFYICFIWCHHAWFYRS